MPDGGTGKRRAGDAKAQDREARRVALVQQAQKYSQIERITIIKRKNGVPTLNREANYGLTVIFELLNMYFQTTASKIDKLFWKLAQKYRAGLGLLPFYQVLQEILPDELPFDEIKAKMQKFMSDEEFERATNEDNFEENVHQRLRKAAMTGALLIQWEVACEDGELSENFSFDDLAEFIHEKRKENNERFSIDAVLRRITTTLADENEQNDPDSRFSHMTEDQESYVVDFYNFVCLHLQDIKQENDEQKKKEKSMTEAVEVKKKSRIKRKPCIDDELYQTLMTKAAKVKKTTKAGEGKKEPHIKKNSCKRT